MLASVVRHADPLEIANPWAFGSTIVAFAETHTDLGYMAREDLSPTDERAATILDTIFLGCWAFSRHARGGAPREETYI